MKYNNISVEELKKEYLNLKKEYEKFKLLNLNLNMARGKPSPEQLDISSNMLKQIDVDVLKKTKEGIDARNYANLDGIIESKEFFSNILKVPTNMILVGGNSSLNLMCSYINMAMQFGILGNTPWNKLKKVKFLCPCPGYDRHFAICELFNIEMINIKIDKKGPDIQNIKNLVESDSLIKGIWCVPKYSNPSGITYKDEIVTAFAKLKPKAKDFRIFWDNAYILHCFTEKDDNILNIFDECEKYDSKDIVLEFTSTSKITFPGGGISAIAASEKNIKNIKNIFSKQLINYNLINQMQHACYFTSYEKLKNHMSEHAKIIKPKFDLVLKMLEKNLKDLNIGSWTNPNGGYFILFKSLKGCANKIFKLCEKAGVVLTNPGDVFPYGKDPTDSNIRIAPTFPSIEELKKALEVFCICVKIATIEKILKIN